MSVRSCETIRKHIGREHISCETSGSLFISQFISTKKTAETNLQKGQLEQRGGGNKFYIFYNLALQRVTLRAIQFTFYRPYFLRVPAHENRKLNDSRQRVMIN